MKDDAFTAIKQYFFFFFHLKPHIHSKTFWIQLLFAPSSRHSLTNAKLNLDRPAQHSVTTLGSFKRVVSKMFFPKNRVMSTLQQCFSRALPPSFDVNNFQRHTKTPKNLNYSEIHNNKTVQQSLEEKPHLTQQKCLSSALISCCWLATPST